MEVLRTNVSGKHTASVFGPENGGTENQRFGGAHCLCLRPWKFRYREPTFRRSTLPLSSALKMEVLRTSVLEEHTASVFGPGSLGTENQRFGEAHCLSLQPWRWRYWKLTFRRSKLPLSSALKMEVLRTNVSEKHTASVFGPEDGGTESKRFGGTYCLSLQPWRWRYWEPAFWRSTLLLSSALKM
jgi:tRNA C32,U32 (ribose-2'-O)-methylase TrmJ